MKNNKLHKQINIINAGIILENLIFSLEESALIIKITIIIANIVLLDVERKSPKP